MKILQTPIRFHPYIGGTEAVALNISRELVKRGHQVKVICADEPHSSDNVVDGIQVKRLPYIAKIGNTNIMPGLYQALMREDFDVLHTHFPHPYSSDISAFAATRKKKPLFVTYNNDITGEGFNKNIADVYNRMMLPGLLKTARKIFISTPGYIERSAFLKNFQEKIVVAPLAVDTGKFKPLGTSVKEANSIFFLSRLDEFHRYKGLDCLLSALEKLLSVIPFKLYVGGDGYLRDYYLKLVLQKKLEKHVVFLGTLSQEDVLRFYNSCEVFILPSSASVHEGFGLVALEAMACAKPVIISQVVGVADDVRKYNAGVVVQPGNSQDLAQAIKNILSDADKRKAMGQAAYELAHEKYTWGKHVDILENEYKKCGV